MRPSLSATSITGRSASPLQSHRRSTTVRQAVSQHARGRVTTSIGGTVGSGGSVAKVLAPNSRTRACSLASFSRSSTARSASSKLAANASVSNLSSSAWILVGPTRAWGSSKSSASFPSTRLTRSCFIDHSAWILRWGSRKDVWVCRREPTSVKQIIDAAYA